ncbi:MAG TPA: N-acetyl-gamma-glutamyl-phosphate reductase [Pseudomonadales bacterium]|nr:N-acetyl-gamma-glutamyl-phosphate reductase [Pseudomonadales bacterium]
MIKVGIVGGTGYTGVELLRLLATHPQVAVVAITSRSDAGMSVAELFPNLRGCYDELRYSEPEVDVLCQCDVVFFATPHGVAMAMMPELVARGVRVIDLSADFRIKDTELWAAWYGMPHSCPDIVAQAVYGLPEFSRKEIVSAQVVAAPGCYPTAVQLGFMPLLKHGLVDPSRLIANAASGVSGAGRQGKIDNLYAEVSDSFKAYGVPGHRHLPEIEQGLSRMANDGVRLTFTPHLLPMIRGIHATLYAELAVDAKDLQALYEDTYRDEPFVDVMPAGSHPQTRSVKGANVCRLAVHRPQGRNTVVVLAVIDNLVKGASGQAIQIMNIMFGFDEREGLKGLGLIP